MKWLVLLLVPTLTHGLRWGPDGHMITAEIAQGLLTTKTAHAVDQILGGETMADASIWADEVKHEQEYRWSSPLHFYNSPNRTCDVNMTRDCADSVCVMAAIQNYTERLMNS